MKVKNRRKGWSHPKLRRILVIGAVTCLLFTLFLYSADIGRTADLAMQDALLMNPTMAFDTRIILLGIDEAALAAVGPWNWPRSVMADLVSTISSGRPAAIGLDILFTEASSDPAGDEALANAVRDAGNVVLPVSGLFGKNSPMNTAGVLFADSASYPLPALKSAAVLGHINVLPESQDGVVRRVVPAVSANGRAYDSFAWELYRMAASAWGTDVAETDSGIRTFGSAYARRSASVLVDRTSSPRIDYIGEPGDYGFISVASVLDGSLRPSYFKDAIVLVGPVASGIPDDYYTTPLNRQGQMKGLEIHVNILQNYLDGRFKMESYWLGLFFILGVFLLILLTGIRLNPVYTAGVLLAATAGGLWLARSAYASGWVLTLLYPLLGGTLLYAFLLVLRNVDNYLEKKRVTDVFGKYVAPEVVDRILSMGEEGLKLGGTKRDITVLFVDVRGFTPLSEKTDPETLVQILNEYLDLTATSIFHQHGTLDKFIGDATMAVFNAPLDLPDHKMAAIRAALEMKRGADSLNKRLQERFGLNLHFGIGVNSGPAVVGNIGAKFRMDYTAIGDTVNTSARLESNAKQGEILIGKELYDTLSDRIIAEAAGSLKLKGKEQEMQVYRVTGLADEQDGNPARVAATL